MSRFKTELCNNLIELGTCKYGDRCHYAHGAHELRQVSKRHPKYRTEKCKNFELTGKCPFGPRCSYVHPKPDLDMMIEQLTKYLKHTRAPKPEDSDLDCTSNALNIVSSQAPSSAHKAVFASSANTTRTPLSSNSNANILTPLNSLHHHNNHLINHNHQQTQRQQVISSLILENQARNAITNENYHSSSSSSSSALDEFTSFETKHKKPRLISNHTSPSSCNLLASNNPFGTSNPLSDFLNKQSNINAISPSQLTPNKRMFVILCVIAGASAHQISNTSKKSINQQLNNHFRPTFIDIILDTSFTESLSSEKLDATTRVTPTSSDSITYNVIPEQSRTPLSNHFESYRRRSPRPELPSPCLNFTNILSNHHLKFCYKHQELLRTILPRLIHVAKSECVRITKDLRWNCSGFEYLLSKSGTTAQTKESMLVKSILSASMMYLVVRACNEGKHHSCGCDYRRSVREFLNPMEFIEDVQSNLFISAQAPNLNQSDIFSNLHAGLPIRFNKSNIKNQGCLANFGFAAAFTRVFIDSDDVFQLSRASKNLNRPIDSDSRELASMKWTRSAINIHNSNLGRQMVLGAIHTRCRCHGLSGTCQIKSCWDHLLDIDVVINRLRFVYLYDSTKVEATNFGSFERPELSLTRIAEPIEDSSNLRSLVPLMPASSLSSESIFSLASVVENDDRPSSGCLVYLNNSPNYCKAQPLMSHPGTRGRHCAPLKEIDLYRESTGMNSSRANVSQQSNFKTLAGEVKVQAIPGSCELLCCDRGYVSDFVLDLVPSNCRFSFCCQVVCDKCLRQRVQHYCL